MIDIEAQVFNKVSIPLRETYTNPAIFIVGEPVKVPARYPAVTIVEIDNTVYDRTMTSAEMENHANISYEINIYSNKQVGKKAECKAIASQIDTIMQTCGFKRISMLPITNMDDMTIYRINARYKAVVSKNNVIYKI